MERVQRLYDCITEVSDEYIQEAESFENRQGKTLAHTWKYFGSMAAALAVVVGVGLAMTQLGAGSADSSAPAMSAPACSAPAVEEPAAGEVQDSETEHFAGAGGVLEDGAVLRGGAVIELSEEERCVILTEEEASQLGLPEDLEETVAGEAVCWLVWANGEYVPTEEATGIVLYPCTEKEGLFIVSDGVQYLAAAVKELP